MSKIKLLPCSFCGRSAIVKPHDGKIIVECDNYGCHVKPFAVEDSEAESAAREDTVKALEKTKLELEKRITALEADIKQLEERPVEVAVQQSEKIPKDHVALSAYEKMVGEYNERIEKLEAENLEQTRAAYSEKTELEKQLADIQKQLDAAKNAPAEIDTDGVFKAYFENAYKSLDTLVTYVQQHAEYSPKVNALVDNIKKSLEVAS